MSDTPTEPRPVDPVFRDLANLRDRIRRRIGFADPVRVSADVEDGRAGYMVTFLWNTSRLFFSVTADTGSEMETVAVARWEQYLAEQKQAEFDSAVQVLRSQGYVVVPQSVAGAVA